jgi:hypothetical protein
LLIREREENAPFSTHLKTYELLDMPVERFLSMLRFENRGELEDLEFPIDKILSNLAKTGSSPDSSLPVSFEYFF